MPCQHRERNISLHPERLLNILIQAALLQADIFQQQLGESADDHLLFWPHLQPFLRLPGAAR